MGGAQLPMLAVVAGRPGSGQSTLADRLANELRLPLVSRDRIKEGLIRTAARDGAADEVTNARATEVFFATAKGLVREGVSLVVEAAFQHRVWAPRLEEYRKLADVRLVVCQVPNAVAWARIEERARRDPTWETRHPRAVGHAGADEPYDPPQIEGATFEVDTSESYSPGIEAIRAFLS